MLEVRPEGFSEGCAALVANGVASQNQRLPRGAKLARLRHGGLLKTQSKDIAQSKSHFEDRFTGALLQ